jgi:hypothetical protein
MQGRSCSERCVADEKLGHGIIDSLDVVAEGSGEHAQLGLRHDRPIELANERRLASRHNGLPGRQMLMHLQEPGRTNGLFALRAEQPSARRVYQCASLRVGPILCRTAAHGYLGDSRAAGSLARRQRLDEAGRPSRQVQRTRILARTLPRRANGRVRRLRRSISSHDDQPGGFVSSISLGKRSPKAPPSNAVAMKAGCPPPKGALRPTAGSHCAPISTRRAARWNRTWYSTCTAPPTMRAIRGSGSVPRG